jgi:hypothetical protein
MKDIFKESDIVKISNTLCANWKLRGNNYRIHLEDADSQRTLALEIYPNIPIGSRTGSLISVYSQSAHLQLHFCTGYVVSKSLGEVTFISEKDGKISGLIVEKEAGCSLYANVDSELLSGDFTQLGPEVMLTGVALSLSEHILT